MSSNTSTAKCLNQGKIFGRDQFAFQHDFNKTQYFTDDALADLIDNYPREYYVLTHMNREGKKTIWRNGDKGNLNGAELLQAVKQGKVWLCLRRFDIVAPELHRLVNEGFENLESSHQALNTFKRQSSLLVSSPTAQVFYHADVPFICLWHLRGKKRIWIYDPENVEHMPDEVLESVIMRETEEDIPYNSAWDEQAQVYDLEPGQAVTWKLHAPHRVENLSDLNVSITSEFFTQAAKRKYGVYYTNGFLRRYTPWQPRSNNYNGALAYAKCGMAYAIKKLDLAKKQERKMMCSFMLDKKEPERIIDLSPAEQFEILQA